MKNGIYQMFSCTKDAFELKIMILIGPFFSLASLLAQWKKEKEKERRKRKKHLFLNAS